ncbi:DNA-processing protein DprA [Robertmurraya korlensis]|uniref:DNA-processing protein DprA n=1 Tax=Robertmurraya korlensis TaxID=519977 RepID=UPI00203A8E67|nr:DNA-processing protein DprA [Robertmurraya korlensis]MCM3602160.1 DNA-processing protein DprA [Robertmurraya korlensis]
MDKYWIWLANLKYIGPVMQKNLYSYFNGDLKRIYHSAQEELKGVPGITTRMIQQIIDNKNFKKVDSIIRTIEEKGIGLLPITDERYLEIAKTCGESPILLYFKGRLQNFERSMGVVGARRCTEYGKKVARDIGQELAKRDIVLVSGFAKGIDSYSQAACMKAGGKTISFLGSGVDICYPSEQRKLYDELIESGSIFLSKYPPGTPVKQQHFIERNALISAWSNEVVIVEAGVKSGALWTAKFAERHKREVYAVPHPIYSLEGQGCNQLLVKGKKPYIGVESVFQEKRSGHSKAATKLDTSFELLEKIPQSSSISKLKQMLWPEYEDLEEQLFSMELEGRIIIRGDLIVKI